VLRKLLLTLLVVGFVAQGSAAWAITAEVAKKCQAFMSAKFPPRLPSNPAAGSAQGSAIERQDYLKKCVANGGQPPEDDRQKSAK
jgi:hypothetical protein